MQRRGYDVRIIDATGLWALLHSEPAQVLQPHEPTDPQVAPHTPGAGGTAPIQKDRLCSVCYLRKPLALFDSDSDTCRDCA